MSLTYSQYSTGPVAYMTRPPTVTKGEPRVTHTRTYIKAPQYYTPLEYSIAQHDRVVRGEIMSPMASRLSVNPSLDFTKHHELSDTSTRVSRSSVAPYSVTELDGTCRSISGASLSGFRPAP
eukprot:Platyproteum_vivax@DN107_c0_g1_i3.p1